jgi:alkylhydroperoxidase family enzyme
MLAPMASHPTEPAASKTRIEPLAPEDWDVRTRELLEGTVANVARLEGQEDAASDGRVLNILRTVAHHPDLLEAFLGFASALAQRGVLSRRDSELLALRAAWNCRSPFEWGHHVSYGRAAGLSELEIERIPDGPGAAGWSDADRALLRAADELHASQQISDTTWGDLRGRLSDAQLVELTFVVGQYTMLSMVANATGVPLEPHLPQMPRR